MIAVKDMENTDKQEILEAIAGLADHMDDRFQAVDRRFEAVDRRFEAVDRRFEVLEGRFGVLEGKVGGIGNQMVTKDYLDRKLAEHRGETVLLIRRALSPSV